MNIPLAVASVVLFEERKYLIQKHSLYGTVTYCLIGHRELGSKGFGTAWHRRDEITLVDDPSEHTWKLLLEAVNEDDD